jgi:hypothetical protein
VVFLAGKPTRTQKAHSCGFLIVSLKGSLQELSNEYPYHVVLIIAKKTFITFMFHFVMLEVASSPKRVKGELSVSAGQINDLQGKNLWCYCSLVL